MVLIFRSFCAFKSSQPDQVQGFLALTVHRVRSNCLCLHYL